MCTHLYHDGCLLSWLKKKKTCPLCLSAVKPDRPVQVVTVPLAPEIIITTHPLPIQDADEDIGVPQSRRRLHGAVSGHSDAPTRQSKRLRGLAPGGGTPP